MKKLAIDAREWTPGATTGIGNFLEVVASGAALSGACQVVLLGDRKTVFPPNINAQTARVSALSGILYDQFALVRILRDLRADFFYSPYPKIPFAATALKKVSSIFDLTYVVLDEYRRELKNMIYARGLLGAYAKNAAAVVTLSRSSKADIVKFLGVAPEKIHIVQPAVNARFKPPDVSVSEAAGIKYGLAGKEYILTVGNALPHKNLARLESAYESLPSILRKRYDLVFVGARGSFPRPGGKNDCAGAARHIGYVPDCDMPAVYGGASLFVFPSLYEGFGLPPVEAMACGCPVACSSSSSMPEVLGDACVYFDPRDTADMARVISDALDNSSLRRVLREKGFARSALYTPASSLGAFLGVFGLY